LIIWANSLEKDRMSNLIDLANAVRFAQNGTKEQYSQFIQDLMRLAS